MTLTLTGEEVTEYLKLSQTVVDLGNYVKDLQNQLMALIGDELVWDENPNDFPATVTTSNDVKYHGGNTTWEMPSLTTVDEYLALFNEETNFDNAGTIWSPFEKSILTIAYNNHIMKCTVPYVSSLLGRSEASVRSQVSVIGLRTENGFIVS